MENNSIRGLKGFSRHVWLKVQAKKETDYNQVADEMLADLRAEALADAQKSSGTSVASTPQQYEDRNVRRRVYDALNVLLAVGVIERDKSARKIMWKGLTNKSLDEVILLEVREGVAVFCGLARIVSLYMRLVWRWMRFLLQHGS